jgi:hypothetical protein
MRWLQNEKNLRVFHFGVSSLGNKASSGKATKPEDVAAACLIAH